MRSGQHADEAIVELVDGRILHRFLLDLHRVTDGTKQVQFSQFQTNRCQTGTAREMSRCLCGRLVHDDGLLSLV